jgi:2,3-bisphosphoglycerate-independent phosphoglycerate mutase
MSDLPVEESRHKTSLDAPETPNMDHLAKVGKAGLVYTVGKGIAPESDVAVVISILGYDSFKYSTSIGIEAIGADVAIKNGDLALRCN